jgi:beta-glucosidase
MRSKCLTALLLTTAAWADPSALTVVSSASYQGRVLAVESIATAFGTGLAPSAASAISSPLPVNLAGIQVLVQDSAQRTRAAGLYYVSPGQINFQIPAGTAAGQAIVTVQDLVAGPLASAAVTIGAVAPGLFNAALLVVGNRLGQSTQTVTAAPIDIGSPADQAVLELFGTGIRGRTSLDNVTCTIGGISAQVLYAGSQADNVGLDQVNVSVPHSFAGVGTVNVEVTVDAQQSNTFAIAISPSGDQLLPARAAALVAQMTLAEKIQSLHGIQDANDYRVVPGIARLGIPLLNITNGPAGAGNGGPGHQGPATALPAPISLAATWDIHMAALYGRIAGAEAKDLANGFVEGPDINIARVPQNGRSFEAFGEDPYLVGQTAANEIAGIQSQGLIAESKHYAGNNQETNRLTINDIIDERTLREIYLPAFETTVKQSHVGGVMCAYNQVNGAYSCENGQLMNQILKTEWGFDGVVTSDFGAVHSTVPSANAGLDLEMPTGIYFDSAFLSAVQSGAVAMPEIDDKLSRRFQAMMRFGVFDNPPGNQPIPIQTNGTSARQLAEAGMVLLKNAGGVLPLNAGALHSVALIGPYAVRAKAGGGGSSQVTPAYTVDPLPGIQSRLGAGVKVSLADGSNIAQAVALAQSADAAIVMVGDDEAEGADHSLSLSGTQDQLVQAVAAANARTVVVVKSGAPVFMPWVNLAPAILEAWYPGEEDGNAVAAVLFGDVNPSGKLPVTFPQKLGDLATNTPAQYPGVNGVENYSEGVFVGYRYFDANNIQPLFPFGHGLSYTSFTYRNLVLTSAAVEFDLANAGTVAGAEVAQVYIGMPSTPQAPQPPAQLKGYRKVFLPPGQTSHVRIEWNDRAFSYWDVNLHAWNIAPGTYGVLVGSSSRDIRLQGTIALSSSRQTGLP